MKGEGNPVQFTARIANTFELKSVSKESLDGKKIRIAADATLDNATTVATVDGDALNLETVIKWKKDQTQTTTFAGLYQNVESGDAPAAPTALKMEYDMVNGGNYDYVYHESFLTATAKNVTPETPVNLVFKHPFAKLAVTVTKEIEGEIAGVELRNVVLAGTLNLATAAIEEPASASNVAMVKTGTNAAVYEAVIMPVAAKPIIAVTIGEEVYKFAVSAQTEFAANKTYTAALTIKDTTPTAGEAVGFTFDVVDWEAGAALETEEIVPVWSVIGLGGDWNTDIPMTKTVAGENKTDGTWEATIAYADGDEFKLRWEGEWTLNMGMNATWDYYGLGDFSDGFLVANSDKNIILEAAGNYKLSFTYPSKKLVITAVD